MFGQGQTLKLLRAIEYDAARRRLWLFGQRCHHGATGAVLTAAAVGGLAAARISTPATVALAATGSVLMVHDWKDRGIWFKRGYGTQP
jgi:hypothetical protein